MLKIAKKSVCIEYFEQNINETNLFLYSILIISVSNSNLNFYNHLILLYAR